MTAESLPCHNEDSQCAVRLLFYILNTRKKQLTTLALDGLHTEEVKCRQQIDVLFSFISESSRAFPCLRHLVFADCSENTGEMVRYLKERLKAVRELGGLRRLQSIYFGGTDLIE